MSIRSCMIIISLSIVSHFDLTKTTDLTFIGCHNVRLESYRMAVTSSVCASSWHDDANACTLTIFVPYPLNKFILTLSFSYWWLWHLSVLTVYHILSSFYVRILIVTLCLFSPFLHSVFCLFSFCLHSGLDTPPFRLNTLFDSSFV